MKTTRINIKTADDCPFREYIDSDCGYHCTFDNSEVDMCDELQGLIPIKCPLTKQRLEIFISSDAVKNAKIRELKNKIEIEEKNAAFSEKGITDVEKNLKQRKKYITERYEIIQALKDSLAELENCEN